MKNLIIIVFLTLSLVACKKEKIVPILPVNPTDSTAKQLLTDGDDTTSYFTASIDRKNWTYRNEDTAQFNGYTKTITQYSNLKYTVRLYYVAKKGYRDTTLIQYKSKADMCPTCPIRILHDSRDNANNHIDFNIKFNNNIEYVRVELTGPAEPAFSIDNPKSCYNDIVYSSNFYVNDLKLTLDTSTTANIPMFQFVITR